MGTTGISRVCDLLFAQRTRAGATPAHVRQLERVVAAGDRAAHGLLPTSGNRFRLSSSTAEFADEAATDIRAAQHHVNLSFYGFQAGQPGGPISEKLTSALLDRAREIPVTVHVDQAGSGMLFTRGRPSELVERLRDGGANVAVHRLPGPLRRGGNDDAWRAVDHRKIVEIDGRVAWAGGANAVDAWAAWPDLMQRVEGPAAAQMGAVMAARWRDLGGVVTPERTRVLRSGLTGPVDDAAHATRILVNGNRHQRELSQAFVDVAAAARDRFVLKDPYLSDPRAMGAVVDAARRLGPRAELFVSPKATTGGQRQDAFTDPLRRAWAYRFHEAGGTVHLLDEFSHAKAWIADDVVGVGSHNKDRSSMRMSYENLVATNDPEALQQVEAVMHHHRDLATTATDDAVRGWRSLARIQRALGLQY